MWLGVASCLVLASLSLAADKVAPTSDKDVNKKDARQVCREVRCGPGRDCSVDEADVPICTCRKSCPLQDGPRTKVCSNHNVTFSSECDLYRQQCLCEKELEGCTDPQYQHAYVDYYAACTEFKPCTAWEMEEYPKRMRDWLTKIMMELAQRNHLSNGAKKMVERAQKQPKHWVLPVIWKFCDLDVSHDKLVSYLEMLPMSAPLKAMEHCTQPFLDGCDSDADGEISFEEWGICLGLEKSEIQDECEAIRK